MFRSRHDDVRVVSPDFAGTINAILDNPAAHGLANTMSGAYDSASGRLAADCAKCFWFDGCHPALLAQQHMFQCAIDALARLSQLASA